MDTNFSAGLPTLAGVAVGVAGYAYAAMSSGSQVLGKTLIAPPRPDELALTYDDGPNPAWTPQLLDVLASYKIQATFFLLGAHAKAQPELVKRIAAAGHLIGNHSFTHANLMFLSRPRITDELKYTNVVLEQLTGQPVMFFRPPFGARRGTVLRIARLMEMTPVMWNVMTSDWRQESAERIWRRLVRKINHVNRRNRAANIVLHDGSHEAPVANREPSVKATARLIEYYQSTHRFVTVDSWLASG